MITAAHLKEIAPNSKDSIIEPLVIYLNKYLANYEINTKLRLAHFIAQAAHESDGFRTLEEYASGKAYEGRKDLGNVKENDGVNYKGRGIFQLTGRANYRDMGAKIGVDLEGNPTLAESPEVSVLTALEYWKSRKLNALADKNDIESITKRINGGFNGLADRKKYFQRALKVLATITFTVNVTVNQAPTAPVPQPTQQTQTVNVVVAKMGDKSPYVADLQRMLIKKGAVIKDDGDFGPKTKDAVIKFQKDNGLNATGDIDTNTLNKLMV